MVRSSVEVPLEELPNLAGLEPTAAWLDDRWLWRFDLEPALRREKYREFIGGGKIAGRATLGSTGVQIYFGSRA